MLASDTTIAMLLTDKQLRLDPYDPQLLQPASIDVRLDRFFRVFAGHRHTAIDPAIEQAGLTEQIEVADGESFVLHPGEFALGATLERVSVSDSLAARIEGKSSLGRLGLMVHSTAGFIDPGFSGHITLELANAAGLPIKLWPGMRIGQLCIFQLSCPSEHPYGHQVYGSRYQMQTRGPVPSRAHWDFCTWPT